MKPTALQQQSQDWTPSSETQPPISYYAITSVNTSWKDIRPKNHLNYTSKRALFIKCQVKD